MFSRKLLLLVGLAVGNVVGAGCSSKAALPKPEKIASRPIPGAAAAPVPHPAKPAPRESAFSTYSNPDYGVTFRYPRNYPLDEGPLNEQATSGMPGSRSQQELESEQAGTELVATIVVPDDSYPNTTFAGGSLQFAVNRYLAGGGCRQLPASQLGDAGGASGTTIIQGVPFAWAEDTTGDNATTEFFERDYAGFSNGTCYEFFLRVGVGLPSEDEPLKPVDQKKFLGQLEKIVASFQTEAKPVSILDERATGQAGRRKP
jgi:hypothetical protein